MTLRCWKCNREISIVIGGWFCKHCCQHGPEFAEPVAKTWREGCNRNTPYRLEETEV